MGVSAANTVSAKNTTDRAAIEVREEGTVNMTVKTYKDMKFRLTVQDLTSRLYIAIKNSSGEVLYSEYARETENYSKIFDLSNLSDGEYAFVVETDKGKAEKAFTVNTETTRSVTTVSAE
ncbi:hypothetical protein GCM10007390_50690 [Persicitalea jodogahamensis]|uniref:Por secretion system C-terminal sorting domain-containing protein n=2 Tax=Persicitalea jodogahamensis TaxID=402147 RepID=A0A8J3DG49_9BACT|nr:hypothetical protein GCM10007390_50690 [Persicitalea jodogahamensis]